MSGNYPDVPGNRMVLDRDGTQMYKVDSSNIVTQLSQADVRNVQDESNLGYAICGGTDTGKLLVFFPEPRNVLGYFLDVTAASLQSGSIDSVETSSNSTNGVDGTWQAVTLGFSQTALAPAYRTAITGVNVNNVRAMRISGRAGQLSYGCYVNLHVYGVPSAGVVLNRLALWHPVLNQRIAGSYLDWGDTPRSSSDDRAFRVKNLSPTLTAVAPLLGCDALSDTAPSVASQHTLSLDAATFVAQVTLPDLPPGAISGVVTLRRVTPANAVLSVWALRLIATATNWTGP